MNSLLCNVVLLHLSCIFHVPDKMETTITLLVLLSTLALCFAAYVKHCYSYWKRRNVVYLKPTFPIGNNDSIMPKGISIGIVSNTFYSEFKKRGLRYGGKIYNNIELCMNIYLISFKSRYYK